MSLCSITSLLIWTIEFVSTWYRFKNLYVIYSPFLTADLLTELRFFRQKRKSKPQKKSTSIESGKRKQQSSDSWKLTRRLPTKNCWWRLSMLWRGRSFSNRSISRSGSENWSRTNTWGEIKRQAKTTYIIISLEGSDVELRKCSEIRLPECLAACMCVCTIVCSMASTKSIRAQLLEESVRHSINALDLQCYKSEPISFPKARCQNKIGLT